MPEHEQLNSKCVFFLQKSHLRIPLVWKKSRPLLMKMPTGSKRITFCVVIDSDVNYSLREFTEQIQIYLADPEGWAGKGYEFVLKDPKGKGETDVVVHLSSPAGLRTAGCDPKLNCAEMGGKHLRVNSVLWTRGGPKSKLSLEDYRQYVVSHEMGHILGRDHEKCAGPGQPAPIMMQQTKGLGECSPNTRVF